MILPINNIDRKQQIDIPVHSFLPDGSTVSTDKINGHFIWNVDPSMCDPNCLCNEFSDEDITYEIPHSRRARRWYAKHAKTPCGLQPYYPYNNDDDYPESIPVTSFSYQI
jgi:hypothetical protein